MIMDSIYGEFYDSLERVREDLENRIRQYSEEEYQRTGIHLVNHIIARVKDEESMKEKCARKDLEQSPFNVMRKVYDSVGIRIVCGFRDDIYRNAELIKKMKGITVVKEKDYVRNVKPNGYRSYHMIVDAEEPFPDIEGNVPGHYFAEIQIRTIAMDSWAALEHQMKYKKEIKNTELIVQELKRCADEMASTDVTMQTIRDLIRGE